MREQQPIPEADPLTRARQLREMDREGLLLTASELSQVLGIEVDSALHEQERFGYKFTRQPTSGKNKWVWCCHRTAGSGATALTADTGNSAGTGGTPNGRRAFGRSANDQRHSRGGASGLFPLIAWTPSWTVSDGIQGPD